MMSAKAANGPTLTRRAALGALAGLAAGVPRRSRAQILMSGTNDPTFRPFDDCVTGIMRAHNVPGAAIAITCQGRLVYARGYGWADKEANIPYEPIHLNRVASVSKPFTSAAILALVQDGKLNLEDRAFPRLNIPAFLQGTAPDPRLSQITVRHLLHHTAGFDRKQSFDPMFTPGRIASTLGIASPPKARDIVSYMMGRPLDHNPGSTYAYSNFGYCVLGRLIEQISGRSYEDFVRKRLLNPFGLHRMRLGHTRLANRAPDEVRYYDLAERTFPSVFAEDHGAHVPAPYGSYCIEAMDSHGGWLASVVDLVRFAAALDSSYTPILTAQSRQTLSERPAAPVARKPDGSPEATYYGLGWSVRPTSDRRATLWHIGKLDGAASLLVRRHDGLTWAVNFNAEKSGENGLGAEIDAPLHTAADAIGEWPSGNLFRSFE